MHPDHVLGFEDDRRSSCTTTRKNTSWRNDVGDDGVLQQWPERLLLQLNGMDR